MGIMIPEWEYLITPFPVTAQSFNDWLRDRGNEGWELVAVNDFRAEGRNLSYIFKRQKGLRERND